MSDFAIFVADCALKSTLILCVSAVAAFALRRHSASLRHSLWSAAIIAAVLMPGLTTVMPRWRTEINLSTITRFSPPLKRVETPDAGVAAAAESVSSTFDDFQQAPVTLWIWLAGMACVAVFLIREAVRLSRIASAAAPFFESRGLRIAGEIRQRFCINRPIRLVQSRTSSMPVTWGDLNPRVLLPSGADDWSDRRMRSVLGHEFAHIRRHDWFVQLIGEIARAMYWFNPLMWFACDRLHQESERACDDAVLALGVESTEYAAELLDLARLLKSSTVSWAPSLAMAHASTLERRFAAMLNPSVDRRSLSRKTALLIAIATLSVVLPVAAMRAPIQSAFGRLFGRVYDPTGAPIKNAAITVFDPVTNVRDFTTSNASGVFEFSRLPAGRYELQTSATGFEAFQISSVAVEANQDVNLNILTVAASLPSDAKMSKLASASNNPSVKSDQPAKLIHQVPPIYPPNAKSAGTQAAVLLDAVVGSDGSPRVLRVVSSGVDADLAKAAVDSVKLWRWEAAVVNGQAVESNVTLTVNFRLTAGGVRGAAPAAIPPPPPAPRLDPLPEPVGIGIGVGVGGGNPVAGAQTAQTRIRQGGNVQQTMMISQVKPIYPAEAKEARIQGIVILETVIGREGDVQEIKVISGHPMLQQAAIDAVSQWKYKPTLLNGQPVEVVSTVTVNFAFQQ